MRMEAKLDPMLRLTGARNVEVGAVWKLLKSRPTGILLGAGFGSRFEMAYLSPNDYEPVGYTRDQADVMPAQIAFTSGLPLSILFTAILFITFWRMFSRLDTLQGIDRTFSLFSLTLAIDIMLGFSGTDALMWSSIGYATMRSLGPTTIASK